TRSTQPDGIVHILRLRYVKMPLMSLSERLGSPITVSSLGSLPSRTITVPWSSIQSGLTSRQSQPSSSSWYGLYTSSGAVPPVSGSSPSISFRPYSPEAVSHVTQIIAASPSTQETTTTPYLFHGSNDVLAPTPKFS